MKRKILKLAMLLSALFPAYQANATRYDVTTTIDQVRYHANENSILPAWQGVVWITLDSPGNLVNSTCDIGTSNGKHTLVVQPGNEWGMAIILTAISRNATVVITVDDNDKFPATSSCVLQYVTMG